MSGAANDGAATVVIAGAGIGGLVLALALKKHCGVEGSQIEVYEQAQAFTNNAGGAIGLYANGLRVLRDISPELVATIRSEGYDYVYRRWYRHDGSEVACAKESALSADPELQSIGIRRWRLQKVLFDAATAAGVVIKFKKRVDRVVEEGAGGLVDVFFADGSTRRTELCFGADGVKSKVREAVAGARIVEFTGVTCLMGAAKVPRTVRGISFPASSTTKNHACYYPVGESEQVFQLFFPADTPEETWGTLSPEASLREGAALAERLRADGWAEEFVKPLEAAESIIKVGLFTPTDPLETWVKGRCVLLGDAAHPPVPYIGQGANMAIEDVGILSLLLREYCYAPTGAWDPSDAKLAKATKTYEALRVPRTKTVLGSSHKLGATQQNRADSALYNLYREWAIKIEVAVYGTLSIMLPGPQYEYQDAVKQAVKAAA